MSSAHGVSAERHIRRRMQNLTLQPGILTDGPDPQQQQGPCSEAVSFRKSRGSGSDLGLTKPRLSTNPSLDTAVTDRWFRGPRRPYLPLNHFEKRPVTRSSTSGSIFSEENPRKLVSSRARPRIRKRKKGSSDLPQEPMDVESHNPLLQTIVRTQSSKFAPLTFLRLDRYRFQRDEWIELIQHLPELQVLDLHFVQGAESQQDGIGHWRDDSRIDLRPLEKTDGSLDSHRERNSQSSRNTLPFAYTRDRRPCCPLVHTLILRGPILIPEVLEYFPNLETLAFEGEGGVGDKEEPGQGVDLEDDLTMNSESIVGGGRCYFDGGSSSSSSSNNNSRLPAHNTGSSRPGRAMSALLEISSMLKDHCQYVNHLVLNDPSVVSPLSTQYPRLGCPMGNLIRDIIGLTCFTVTTQVLAHYPGLLDILRERHYDHLVSVKILSRHTQDSAYDDPMTLQEIQPTTGNGPFVDAGESNSTSQPVYLETLGRSCLRLLEKCVQLETVKFQVPLSLQALTASTMRWACQGTLKELGLEILELSGKNALDPEEEQVMAMFIQSMCKTTTRGQSSSSYSSFSSTLGDTRPSPLAPLTESPAPSIGSSQSSLDFFQSSSPFPSSSTTSGSDISSSSSESRLQRGSYGWSSDSSRSAALFSSTDTSTRPKDNQTFLTRHGAQDSSDLTPPIWWSLSSSSPNSYSSATEATTATSSFLSDGESAEASSSSWTQSTMPGSIPELTCQSLEDASIEEIMSPLDESSPNVLGMDLEDPKSSMMTSPSRKTVFAPEAEIEEEATTTTKCKGMYGIESVGRLVALQFWIEHRLLVYLPQLERFSIGRRTFSLARNGSWDRPP